MTYVKFAKKYYVHKFLVSDETINIVKYLLNGIKT